MYDKACFKFLQDGSTNCEGMIFKLNNTVKGPFNVYYQLSGFYDNY